VFGRSSRSRPAASGLIPCAIAAIAIACASLPASAAASLTWSAPIGLDTTTGHDDITALACPSTGQCTAADNSGYEIDEAEVIFWGRCPDCRATGVTPAEHSEAHS